MKIVNKGVRIEDTPWIIDITPDASPDALGQVRPLCFADQAWTVEDATAVRDALTEALRQLDILTGAEPNPEHYGFTVGQVLTGDEDLPIGTVVEDSDPNGSDQWTFRGHRWETAEGEAVSVNHWRGTIERYGPVTIVSLP